MREKREEEKGLIDGKNHTRGEQKTDEKLKLSMTKIFKNR